MTNKKGRTLGVTVNDLLESKRWQIAINNYKDDPQFMKAILIELGYECMKVAKNTVIKTYALHSSLDAFELIPMLRNISDFTTFNIWWSLTPVEQKLYIADPKNVLSPEERSELLEKVKSQFMGGEVGGINDAL